MKTKLKLHLVRSKISTIFQKIMMASGSNQLVLIVSFLLLLFLRFFFISCFSKGADNSPDEIALWIDQQNPSHVFENINRRKTWSEYNDDILLAEYLLYKQTESDFILQNKTNTSMYLLLTKSGFVIGELNYVTNSNTPKKLGFWINEPEFPKGKIFNNMLLFGFE